MRCPDCNKFVSYDDSAEPEVNDLEVSPEGGISGSVRVFLPCGECGTELKEYTFDIDTEVELPKGHVCKHAEQPGCPTHVAGTACAVCGWDGVAKPRSYPIRFHRFEPGKRSIRFAGDKESTPLIGDCGNQVFAEGEEEQMNAVIADAERQNSGIPTERKHIPAREELDDLQAEVESVELTTRSDCGKNKRTGLPNKYNPRYATTYYGYHLEGKVTCGCGEVTVTFESEDEVPASGMDELT